MTQHNIVGSEADRPIAHILVRIGRARRRVNPVAAFFSAVAVVGVIAGLIDAAIGAPVCLGVVSAAFVVWLAWPSR